MIDTLNAYLFYPLDTSNNVSDYLLVFAVLLLAWAAVRLLYLFWRLTLSKILARAARGLWRWILRRPAQPKGPFSAPHPGGKRILIIGDSTAFGTGAARPEESIAGRLSHDFPDTEIVNYAVNGSLTSDAVRQLGQAQGQHFDLVILSTGGNDIWHFTRLKKIAAALEATLERAVTLSDRRVIVLLYANFGPSPLFPFVLRSLLQSRTEKVRRLYVEICGRLKIPCIDLYTAQGVDPVETNPFMEDPGRYFSKDYMHPNSTGYGLWYRRMWRIMVENHYLFEEHPTEYILKK